MKKRFDRSGTARRKAVTAIAALTMALVLAVGGAGAATLLSAQPETLTVGAVVPHITAEAPQQTTPADPAPQRRARRLPPEQTAESTAQPQQAESVPEQAEKPETAEAEPAGPEESAAAPETPETPEEFRQRVQAWYAEKSRLHLAYVYRTPADIAAQIDDVNLTIKDMIAAERDKTFYRNPESCKILPCPYKPKCLDNVPDTDCLFTLKKSKNEELLNNETL